jgi:hypothetical protein
VEALMTEDRPLKIAMTIAPEHRGDFDRMTRRTGLSPDRLVFEALSLYEWAIDEAVMGRRVGSFVDGSEIVERPVTPGIAAAFERSERPALRVVSGEADPEEDALSPTPGGS